MIAEFTLPWTVRIAKEIGIYYFAIRFVAEWNVEKVLFTPGYHAMK